MSSREVSSGRETRRGRGEEWDGEFKFQRRLFAAWLCFNLTGSLWPQVTRAVSHSPHRALINYSVTCKSHFPGRCDL